MTDGSNIAEWANVGATLIGSIGTTGALFVSYRLLKREFLRDRRRDAEEELRHANNVSFWSDRNRVFIRNASDLPVYDVVISFRYTDPRTCAYRISYIGPMGPGATRIRTLPKPSADSRRRSRIRSVTFRDTAGVRWQREEHGYIRKLVVD
jgi:hypothetical protein